MKELNGDLHHKLSFRQKIWYLLYNLGRGVLGYLTWQRTIFWSYAEYQETSNSPGRRYLDFFLLHKLPEILTPQEVTVLDVGCGSGYLRDMLEKAGYTGSYTGVDAERDVRYQDTTGAAFSSAFFEIKIEDFQPEKTYELVISNTALEHVADDSTAVERCRELTKVGGVQVHIVPAFWSLFAYLWHGYRQYNPRRIKKLFHGQSYQVYRLGGLASLLLHVCAITIPERIIGMHTLRTTGWYYRVTFRAQKLDKILPFCSMMYVIVVQKND